MADENKFLHLGNSNDKILYEKFKGKLEKKDIAANNKLLQIFNFFDKDGNGIIETANSKGVNEMQSLWNAVRTSATKNNNSIFEESEAQELLCSSVDSTGKSLADNQVTANDLFGFLRFFLNKETQSQQQIIQLEDVIEYTPEEIKEISIQTVSDSVKQAKKIFDAQKAQQGAVSDLVDGTKETFDTEYASSRVNRYLMNEEFCAQVLQRSQEGNLTEKEYLEAKIELAVSMLPELENTELKSTIIKQIVSFGLFKGFGNKTKAEQERIVKEMEIEYLKEALKNLTPEELTVFIKTVTSLSDEDYKERCPILVEDLIKKTIDKKEDDNKFVPVDIIGAKIINPPRQGSIEDIVSHQDAYRAMEFEETFSKERVVEYNPEAIMDYTAKEAQLQFLVGMHNRNEAIKNILHQATVTVDGNNKYGAPQHDAIETCNQNLANQIETAFRSLYSKDAAEAQRVINEIVGENSGISIIKDQEGNLSGLDFYGSNKKDKINIPINSYSLVQLSKGLQQKLEDNYQVALNGKTLDEYSEEVTSAYQMAYGAKNAQDMANAFAQSQQEGIQNTKAVVQGLGMVAMVAGQLIPVGGQAATALIVAKGAITYGGMLTSTLGSVGVSAAENYFKAGGPTEEDKKAMLQELGTSLALVGTGMGIGKGSEAIFRTLVMKNCPKLIAFTAEVGVDATASLLADYAITGQIDLSGEGIAQLQNILVGIIGAKGARNYLYTHAGDVTAQPATATGAGTKSTSPQTTTNITIEELKNIIENKTSLNNTSKPINIKKIKQQIMNVYDKEIDFTKFDYTNSESHIKNLTKLSSVPSNSFSRVIDNGYFYSEDGLLAIEIASKYFKLQPEQRGFVSPLCLVLSEFTPREIIVLEKRGLLNAKTNILQKRLHTITKMSDKEYEAFVIKAQNSIKSTGKSYEDLKQELFSLLKQTVSDTYYLELAERSLGAEESVVVQIEMLKFIENTPLKLDNGYLLSFLSKININNSNNVKNVLDILLTKPNLKSHQLNSIISLTNNYTEKILIELLAITDLPVNKIIEICGHNNDFVNGKLSKEIVLEKINNDPYIKTMRAIKDTTVELRPSNTNITSLDPTNIEASSLALVHMTKYEPEGGMIFSTRDKLGGSRNSVHFTLNHAVTAHRAGDWDDCATAIIMPYSSTVKTNFPGKFIEGMPNDLYTNGSVKIPEGSVIVKQNKSLQEGIVKIVEHPTIKGVKLIETSMLPHDLVPTILNKMGYASIQGDAPLGLFNYGAKNGNSVDDVMQNFEAWNDFCKAQGLKPARHTGTPGALAEALIEDVGKLNANESWVVESRREKTNYKQSILNDIEVLKKWQTKGYFVSYDLDAFAKIIEESATPRQALMRMQKELNIHPTINYKTFHECSLDHSLNIYVEWLIAVEDLTALRKYVIDHELP